MFVGKSPACVLIAVFVCIQKHDLAITDNMCGIGVATERQVLEVSLSLKMNLDSTLILCDLPDIADVKNRLKREVL